MAGKSRITADGEQRKGLQGLARSRDRGEADRARAILLTLSGWTSPRVAEAFGVREDTVRLWRSAFANGGIEALKASVAPGPAPVKTEAALRVVTPLLEAPVADRPNWTIPRLITEIEAREGVRIGRSQLSKALRKKLPLAAAPAHVERPPDCRRDRTRGTAPSTAQGSGRSRRHHPPLRRRERGPDAPLSGAGVGLARCGPAGAGARTSEESGDNRLARSCHAPVDCAHEPDQAHQRLHRSPRATRPPVRSSTGTNNKTGRASRGQRADPCQQAHS